MSKWVKSYPDGRTCRKLSCTEYKVDDQHNVLIMEHGNDIDSYVMWHDSEWHSTPFLYMFGTPAGELTYNEIVEMTITVAPDYYHLFEEE